jgi:hypothetical protein
MPSKQKSIPFEFAIENIFMLEPRVRAMFGAHAVYVGEKLMFILRDKNDSDSGVWLSTKVEHHESLRKDFPNMHSIYIFETPVTAWQVLDKTDDDFEKNVNHLCDLILKGDSRIGTIPKPKKKKTTAKK